MRILLLTPWPFRRPRNGGQLRGSAIAEAYREAGHEVRSVALYDGSRAADDVWPNDVPITPGVVTIMNRRSGGQSSSLEFWHAVAEAEDSFGAYAHAVRTTRPHVVQFEEPFLWPLVCRLRAEGLLDGAKIVHSSHNFETAAQRDLQAASADINAATLSDIERLEREIAQGCDLVVAVSEGDARAFAGLGARRWTVAANGAGAPEDTPKTPLQGYLGYDPAFALFISSAHPPNARGLADMAAGAKCPLLHGELLIGGQVGGLVRSAPSFARAGRIMERSRFLGWVDTPVLNALIDAARVIILPKTLGGGSNLKTAEALMSGRPIVATTRAFEGFEAYETAPGVIVEDQPDRFWDAVDGFLHNPSPSARLPDSMSGLLWSHCLGPMVAATEALVLS
jgi:glycosyltransferase involved in cell wall biosynthesis